MKCTYSLSVCLCLVSLVVISEQRRSVNIKLVDGSSDAEGTILIRRAGSHSRNWGFVCDDGWSKRAGNVVCKELGYDRVKKITRFNYFKTAQVYRIVLDNVMCRGDESSIALCRHDRWYTSDCTGREAAGVICENFPESEQSKEEDDMRLRHVFTHTSDISSMAVGDEALPAASPPQIGEQVNAALQPQSRIFDHHTQGSQIKSIEMLGGRNPREGYVKVTLSNGWSGTICSDNWGLTEAMVVCRELKLDYANRQTQSDFFRGSDVEKVLYDVNCTGHEKSLNDCRYTQLNSYHQCTRHTNIAGVICTSVLPDLMPNITQLENSITLQDRYMAYLTCSMEENCLSSSAYELKESRPRGWSHLSRRLLRFSSSIYNGGTADFRPRQHRNSWQWHSCHMHYHSMDTFSHYDVLDDTGRRVAEGHKASFCLEDVDCDNGVRKKYSCRGFGDQGISVGCADVYKADVDCQWIDITDLDPGNYVFKINVNPEMLVPELSFDNNAALCDLHYSGFNVKLTNCRYTTGG